VFSAGQIGVSAVVGAVASLIALLAYNRWARNGALAWSEAVLLAVVVGLSILVWRAAGNTPSLNDDPIPAVSPNDVLCPVLTYVSLGVYGAFRPLAQRPDWPRVRALLTALSLVVNVVTI
jgi:hypothetical protein